MIQFTIVWSKDAIDALAEIWLSAADRAAVTAASSEIDAELTVDPSNKGWAMAEGLRGLLRLPLKVIFIVREEDRLVEVVSVRAEQEYGANGEAPQ